MANPRASTAVVCSTCNKTIGRKADLARHMRVHSTDKEALMHYCSHPGCAYRTLQRSNLVTHRNVHSRERPHKCPEDGCDFSTSDPGSLTRHRKEIHGYEPKANSGSRPSTIARKAARQQRRISPYTRPSSISPSRSVRPLSPLSPPSGIHSPRPRVPALLDPSPPSSPLPANAHGKGGIKNTSAAYSTELITKLPRVNDLSLAPNRKPGNSLLTSGLSTVLEAPTVDYTQLPVPEQGNLCAVDLPAHPVSAGTTPIEATPAYTAPTLPAPFGQYPANYVHAPTPASLPSYEGQYTVGSAIVSPPAPLPSYGVRYAAENVTVPTPTSPPSYWAQYVAENATVPTPASPPSYWARYAENVTVPTPVFHPSYWAQYAAENVIVPTPAFHPSYRAQYTVNNASNRYSTDAASFNAQFSQPQSLTAPDMGFYSQVVDQRHFYTAPTATSGLPIQGIYPY